MQSFKPRITSHLLPDGWAAKESITLLEPNRKANVIASSEPLAAGIDTKSYADMQGDLLRSDFPGYTETLFEPTEVWNGRPGYIRRFQWEPPNVPPVTQIQIYYTENGQGFTATATVPSEDSEHFELQLRLILGGLTIDQ
jgi:hypothetical protein